MAIEKPEIWSVIEGGGANGRWWVVNAAGDAELGNWHRAGCFFKEDAEHIADLHNKAVARAKAEPERPTLKRLEDVFDRTRGFKDTIGAFLDELDRPSAGVVEAIDKTMRPYPETGTGRAVNVWQAGVKAIREGK